MDWKEGIQEFGFDCKVRKSTPKTINFYNYQTAFEGEPLELEYEKYISALKESGFEFSRAKDFYNHDCYMIKKDGKLYGWLGEIDRQYEAEGIFRVTLPVPKK